MAKSHALKELLTVINERSEGSKDEWTTSITLEDIYECFNGPTPVNTRFLDNNKWAQNHAFLSISYVLNHVLSKELGIFEEVAAALPDFNHYDVTETVDVLPVLQEVLTDSWSEEGELAYFCIVKVVANEYSEGLKPNYKKDIKDNAFFEKYCLKLKEALLLFSRAAIQQFYLENYEEDEN